MPIRYRRSPHWLSDPQLSPHHQQQSKQQYAVGPSPRQQDQRAPAVDRAWATWATPRARFRRMSNAVAVRNAIALDSRIEVPVPIIPPTTTN